MLIGLRDSLHILKNITVRVREALLFNNATLLCLGTLSSFAVLFVKIDFETCLTPLCLVPFCFRERVPAPKEENRPAATLATTPESPQSSQHEGSNYMNGMSQTGYSARSLLKSASISASKCIGVKQRNQSEVKRSRIAIKRCIYYKFVCIYTCASHSWFFFAARGIEQWCNWCFVSKGRGSPHLIMMLERGVKLLANSRGWSYTHPSQGRKQKKRRDSMCLWFSAAYIYELILITSERLEILSEQKKPSTFNCFQFAQRFKLYEMNGVI